MLELVPISLKEANAFVERHHRHHRQVTGHKFSVAAAQDGQIVGVAIVGIPVSRYLDDGWTLEVNNMGYKKLITYILDTETGTSLKAAGWKCVGEAGEKDGLVFEDPRWIFIRRR